MTPHSNDDPVEVVSRIFKKETKKKCIPSMGNFKELAKVGNERKYVQKYM